MRKCFDLQRWSKCHQMNPFGWIRIGFYLLSVSPSPVCTRGRQTSCTPCRLRRDWSCCCSVPLQTAWGTPPCREKTRSVRSLYDSWMTTVCFKRWSSLRRFFFLKPTRPGDWIFFSTGTPKTATPHITVNSQILFHLTHHPFCNETHQKGPFWSTSAQLKM